MVDIAHVTLEEGESVDRHIEPVASQVLEEHVIAGRTAHLEAHHALEDAYAVVPVHHGVSDVELGEGVVDGGTGGALPSPPAGAEQFLGTEKSHAEARQYESG